MRRAEWGTFPNQNTMNEQTENEQGQCALHEEEVNLMRIAARITAFLKERREFPNPSDYHPFYAAE